MARLRSPEKRRDLLEAAIDEIADSGLGAPTARIAQRAGVAAGTLFTYFATKEELLNELYYELKLEVYSRINPGFPAKGTLEQRVHHIWTSYVDWALDGPRRRKVSIQLNVSDVITPATRERIVEQRSLVDATLAELSTRASLRDLPPGFAGAAMASMQDAALEFIARKPSRRKQISEGAFRLLWKAMK